MMANSNIEYTKRMVEHHKYLFTRTKEGESLRFKEAKEAIPMLENAISDFGHILSLSVPAKTGEVQLIQFKGKNGGFAVNETTLYRVQILGVDANTHTIEPKLAGKSDAVQIAERWASLTGFPLKRYKDVKLTTSKLEKM